MDQNQLIDHYHYLEWRRIEAVEGELAAMEYRASHREAIARDIERLSRIQARKKPPKKSKCRVIPK